MNVEHAEQVNGDQAESSTSGRWIRDQLREVADSGLAELERSATRRAEPAAVDEDEATDQGVLDSLAASISTAVVEPMRNLERSRVAHQHQMESSLSSLSAKLEEVQSRLGPLDRELENAKRTAARSQALFEEVRPGIAAIESRVEALDQAFRKDLLALGAGLDEVREQLPALDSRLKSSEETVGKHTVALEAVARLERRRQEASRQLVASVDGLRSSLSRLSSLELVDAQAPSGKTMPMEPPAPDLPVDKDGEN